MLRHSTDGVVISPRLAGEHHAGFMQDAAPNPVPVPYYMLDGVLLEACTPQPW